MTFEENIDEIQKKKHYPEHDSSILESQDFKKRSFWLFDIFKSKNKSGGSSTKDKLPMTVNEIRAQQSQGIPDGRITDINRGDPIQQHQRDFSEIGYYQDASQGAEHHDNQGEGSIEKLYERISHDKADSDFHGDSGHHDRNDTDFGGDLDGDRND